MSFSGGGRESNPPGNFRPLVGFEDRDVHQARNRLHAHSVRVSGCSVSGEIQSPGANLGKRVHEPCRSLTCREPSLECSDTEIAIPDTGTADRTIGNGHERALEGAHNAGWAHSLRLRR